MNGISVIESSLRKKLVYILKFFVILREQTVDDFSRLAISSFDIFKIPLNGRHGLALLPYRGLMTHPFAECMLMFFPLPSIFVFSGLWELNEGIGISVMVIPIRVYK